MGRVDTVRFLSKVTLARGGCSAGGTQRFNESLRAGGPAEFPDGDRLDRAHAFCSLMRLMVTDLHITCRRSQLIQDQPAVQVGAVRSHTGGG